MAQAFGGYLVSLDSTLTAIDIWNEPLHYYCSSVGTVAASPNAHKAETLALYAVLHGGIDAMRRERQRYGAGAAATIAVNSAQPSFFLKFPFLFFQFPFLVARARTMVPCVLHILTFLSSFFRFVFHVVSSAALIRCTDVQMRNIYSV